MTLQSWYLSDWQRPYIWAPTTALAAFAGQILLELICQMVVLHAGQGYGHSWANQGWRAAVNTFCFREKVCYQQHSYPKNNCKPTRTPNSSLFARGIIPAQTNTPLMETAGLWVHGSEHRFVFWVLLSHLNYSKLSGRTSIPLPAFTPILLWAESPQVFPLLFSLSPYSPTHLLLFSPGLLTTFALSPSFQSPGAKELTSPSVVTDTSVKGSVIHCTAQNRQSSPI